MNKRTKVLVVDDDPLIRDILQRIFKDLGMDAVTASDGSQAGEKLKANIDELAIAVIDLVLPGGVTGWDLIEDWKKNKITADIPLVAITGAHLSDREFDKLNRRTDAIIKKQDFGIEDFKEKISNLLGHQH